MYFLFLPCFKHNIKMNKKKLWIKDIKSLKIKYKIITVDYQKVKFSCWYNDPLSCIESRSCTIRRQIYGIVKGYMIFY